MARKDAEALCLKWVSDLDPSGLNTKRWEEKFKQMSDKQFAAFVEDLRAGRDYISLIQPNLGKTKITTANNFKVAKKYGVRLFQRIWVTDQVTGRKYLSHHEYPIFYLPVRRQIQMVRNKISYAKDNSKVNILTGQPTGTSAAGKISYPETLVLHARGLDKTIQELTWARGGNAGAFKMMNKTIANTGSVNLSELEMHSTGVKSTQVLSTYLKAAHIQNNI